MTSRNWTDYGGLSLSATDLNAMEADIQKGMNWATGAAPISLTGAYANRPAFGTVNTGTFYYATDTLEAYRASGTAGSLATGWSPVGGGAELAYAESQANFTVNSTTAADVTGLTITFTAGERPVKLEFGCLANIQGTPGEVVIRIMDGTTTVKEIHGVSPNTSMYTEVYGSIRKSYTAGASKTLKIQALEVSTAPVPTVLVGSATWPIWMRASSL